MGTIVAKAGSTVAVVKKKHHYHHLNHLATIVTAITIIIINTLSKVIDQQLHVNGQVVMASILSFTIVINNIFTIIIFSSGCYGLHPLLLRGGLSQLRHLHGALKGLLVAGGAGDGGALKTIINHLVKCKADQ